MHEYCTRKKGQCVQKRSANAAIRVIDANYIVIEVEYGLEIVASGSANSCTTSHPGISTRRLRSPFKADYALRMT
jgi:hypothetical protein